MRLDVIDDTTQLILKSNVIDIWSIFIFLDFISHVQIPDVEMFNTEGRRLTNLHTKNFLHF